MPGRALRVTVGTVAGATASAMASDGAALSDTAVATLRAYYDYESGVEPWRLTASLSQADKEMALAAVYATLGWGSLPPIHDLVTGSGTFRQDVLNTLSTYGRCIIRLPAGTYHLTSFVVASTTNYSYGLWHTNLAGFIGAGEDQTFVQMDAASMSSDQLTFLTSLTKASGTVCGVNMLRIDGDQSNPAVMGYLTIQAADQQTITFASDNGIVDNQPAPHGGVLFFKRGRSTNVYYFQYHVRYIGAARACTSLPPFEMENFSSSTGYGYSYYVESDGRRAASIDAAQPRRCGPMAFNSEVVSTLVGCWWHHSNISRYAVNDSGTTNTGVYTVTNCKADHVTDNQNVDPNLNGGSTLGGVTNASLLGWEAVGGTVHVTDSIFEIDNANTSGSLSCNFQFTAPGARNPQGGRFYASGNVYRNQAFPQLDGFAVCRVDDITYWYLDGLATTLDIRATSGGSKLTPYTFTGTTPPSAATLSSAGVTPSTHFLVNVI